MASADSSAGGQPIPDTPLRVGINFGNALLACRDASTMRPSGIAVDLAHELGRRWGAAIEVVSYASANTMADAARTAAWDIAFLATDPARSNEITFTEPYVEIEATYLVPAGSPAQTIADVDREGVRIAVSERSAYDLFLTRTIMHATLLRAPSVDDSVALFFSEKLDALAGLKPLLEMVAARHAGTVVIPGRFTEVCQAIGVPHGGSIAGLQAFVRDVTRSGFVAAALERHGVRGVVVPGS